VNCTRATPAVDRPPAVTIRQPGRNTFRAGMDDLGAPRLRDQAAGGMRE